MYVQSLTTPEAALTYPSLDSCLQTSSVRQYVLASAAQAREAGVRVTPYFIVNGTVVTGIKSLVKFEQLLQEPQ
jgi:predicted DsbA family dithiol-disulfide isomerase